MRFRSNRALRDAKDAKVQALKERLFGPNRGLSGERHFSRPLEGKLLRNWYFPSKYSFQNFKMDEYFEMQADRFKQRPVHPSVQIFSQTLQRVAANQLAVKQHLERHPNEDLQAVLALVSSETAVATVDTEEIAFLLETLRAVAGNEVALGIARQVQNMENSQARKCVLEAFKTAGGTVGGAPSPAEVTFSEQERKILERRHRFVDPLQRRRRLKWMERLLQAKHSAQELKHHSYYKTHPDQQETYPTNMGPVTIKWPSPYQ